MPIEVGPSTHHAPTPDSDTRVGLGRSERSRKRRLVAAAAIATLVSFGTSKAAFAEPNSPGTTAVGTVTTEKPKPGVIIISEPAKKNEPVLPGVTLAAGLGLVVLGLGAFLKSGRNILGQSTKKNNR